MRICFLSLLLAVCVSFSAKADVVAQFTPLADDEHFAYSEQNVPDTDGHMRWDLTLYAVKNNNIENAAELFIWERISGGTIQFTSDSRTAFFHMWLEGKSTLLKADGVTGELRAVVSNVGWGRISTDGRFFASIDPQRLSDFEQANIFLFDIENEIMTQLDWKINNRLDGGGWYIYRFDNIFRIYGTHDGGAIAAVADLNPETMEITVLWDKTDIVRWWEISPPLPMLYGEDWQRWMDDVILQYHDPNIRLRR
jgi:hypothetical protein